MKSACMFAALAFAGAVAPPQISLSLEGMTSAYKLDSSIIREHDLGLTQNDGQKVMSRQDWTEKCAAKRSCPADQTCTSASANWVYTSVANCPFPVANGYDHQDQKVDVRTRVFLMDVEGSPEASSVYDCTGGKASAACTAAPAVDWTKRSTYLFKYDATDQAGNHAEQVVFALILNDDQAPFFQEDCKNSDGSGAFVAAITVEAASSWRLCELYSYDNVDSLDTGARIQYQIEFLDRAHDSFSNVYQRCVGKSGEFTSWDQSDHVRDTEGNLKFSTYAEAKQYMDPHTEGVEFVGKYLMTVRATDKAGVYGHNAVNNYRDIQQAILVRDQTAPAIYLAGSNPEIVECRKEVPGAGGSVNVDGVAYQPTDDVCHDKLDTETLFWGLPVTTTYMNTVTQTEVACPLTCPKEVAQPGSFEASMENSGKVAKDSCPELVKQMARRGTQTLKYGCHDFSGNKAPKVSRTINTVDTLAPTLTMHGGERVVYDAQHDCEHDAAGNHVSDSGISKIFATKADQVTAEDRCDSAVDTSDVTMSWGPREFNCRVLGDYVRTYTIVDQDTNTAAVTRTFTVVDSTIPTIGVVGTDETLEATRDVEYTDKGATCSDVIDGELSHAVEVSGEVVNMRIPGTYTIQYDCQDLSGNEAIAMNRKVVVQDTIKPPSPAIKGAAINYVEAGFPYVDAGATATDTLDGDITQFIWTDGNTVDSSKAFYQARSCQQIFNIDKAANNGEYTITAEILGEFKRIPVHCFFANSKGYTYHLHTAGTPGNCKSLGMIRATAATSVTTPIMNYIRANFPVQANLAGNLDNYVCTVDPAIAELAQLQADAAGTNSGNDASQGKYVIQYNVEDKAGNKADPSYRTVIVKDTLPPVITLHLSNKLIHTSGINSAGLPRETGINHHSVGGVVNRANPAQYNPAAYPKDRQVEPSAGYTGFGNPYMKDGSFMAETASTNGWIIGAVASAVAGVALLGFSARKSTVTSVPV